MSIFFLLLFLQRITQSLTLRHYERQLCSEIENNGHIQSIREVTKLAGVIRDIAKKGILLTKYLQNVKYNIPSTCIYKVTRLSVINSPADS